MTSSTAETKLPQKPKPHIAKQGHPSGDKRFKALEMTMKRNQYRPDALIEVLHKAQETFGYLEEDVLLFIARGLKLPLSRVYGVATFYHLFSLKPSGVHTCVVCLGTACYVKGAAAVLESMTKQTQISVGETTADGQISLMSARCIGACGLAPAVVFDGSVAGKQTPESVIERVQAWLPEEAS
ncbi:MAG: bidirectional hydrogenase complex protein HoxE [Symploca sp. SIO3C6]|uniref:Bidirectional hydrogenase complex protein HoxE n=1 Tax=Symploca sp. SIO1C4 TaxID=2607765 RepID=A0A6B3NH08_9CYAN|nr:bidirectional hydrogenase complex protein HoxE [Symploca sp. SIO3C6]NER30950.1 bidirectional hydrogenase complex protein HoxE [Symploca sp. SIO1C4]NET04321.1 bidirectional hydrogenase complex protein HoxE [Symploca sp. SIO2B6]NET51519.1 bidirectional hydrogenase complex protein HoxE [Merismopedia sp. SIO2A8]